jgi:hypothetical protein
MRDSREKGWDFPRHEVHDAPWEEYYSALGRFMQMFGKVEARLHVVLRDFIIDLTQTDVNYLATEVLDSVIGSMRVAGLRDHITRILRVVNYDESYQEEFSYAFNQLGEIHFLRDRIAHYGASSFSSVEFRTSN